MASADPRTLEDTTCIVTGGSRGVGRETVRGLLALGARVVVVSRDPDAAREARDDVVRTTGNEAVELETADLSSQAEVRDLAARLAARPDPIGVLLHNAAVAHPDRRTTVDGLEMQLAVNHLAPFLLTNLLRDRLVRDAPARVVVVASRAHERATIDFDDLQGERDYRGPRAYDQSKLANVLFTYELARRLSGTGVTANCLHPGVAPTGLNRYLRPRTPPNAAARAAQRARRIVRALARLGRPGDAPRVGTPAEASRTSVYLASDPAVADTTGTYFVDRRPAESAPATHDEALAARLWEVSARLTGLDGGAGC